MHVLFVRHLKSNRHYTEIGTNFDTSLPHGSITHYLLKSESGKITISWKFYFLVYIFYQVFRESKNGAKPEKYREMNNALQSREKIPSVFISLHWKAFLSLSLLNLRPLRIKHSREDSTLKLKGQLSSRSPNAKKSSGPLSWSIFPCFKHSGT